MTLLDILNTTSLPKRSTDAFKPPQSKGRTLTPLEEAICDAARSFQEDGYVLVYHWNQKTEEFTGFQPISKPEEQP